MRTCQEAVEERSESWEGAWNKAAPMGLRSSPVLRPRLQSDATEAAAGFQALETGEEAVQRGQGKSGGHVDGSGGVSWGGEQQGRMTRVVGEERIAAARCAFLSLPTGQRPRIRCFLNAKAGPCFCGFDRPI